MRTPVRGKRLVLFLPLRADPAEGVRVSADLLPLELLQIAAIPDREGYEVVLIDAMVHTNALERVLEACDGALLFASSCILGFQVAHGARVARAVRERYPKLPIIQGGWFPSVRPELYLREGLADAVGLGQGELTFWEVVQAIENGTSLEDVPGLVVLRDGEPHRTAPRPVVGFDKIPDVPWHLLEYEPYVEQQQNPGRWKLRHALPRPAGLPAGEPVRGFSYFSSYGCPEPCTFCCSPLVTNRRWKAIPGGVLADRVLECRERFGFNVLRFQDANFGVAEKRSNEFCERLLAADAPFAWNATYEIETIARYAPESVDRMGRAGCHLVILGAEAGSEAQQTAIKKCIDVEHNVHLALERLLRAGIQSGTSWIIGFPGEDVRSMLATIRRAAQMKHAFPRCASDIFPFRPIPSTEDFDRAVELGYRPPETLEEWGSCLEYKYEVDDIRLPRAIQKAWQCYGSAATFYDGLASECSGLVRDGMRKVAAWRLSRGCFRLPIEQKLYDWYVRLTGQAKEDVLRRDATSGVTPFAPKATV